MLGRVREALFSSLADRVWEARVLDLYAGTGSLGIEALSRGAQHVRFVERSRKVSQVGQGNLDLLGGSDRADWRSGDALAERIWVGEPWDLIFLDPPYPMVREAAGKRQLLDALEALLRDHLAPDGLLMLHAEPRVLSRADFEAPGFDWHGELREKSYGRSTLWYFTPAEPQDETAQGEPNQ